MRLINTTTLKIREFLSEDRIEPYAILSHTWGDDECTLQQMEHPDVSLVASRVGYRKILLCCKQARKDGLEWAWVDTCCIDKTSTAELSEAINSMFRWYCKAARCYAYLSDVENITQLEQSRWFTRGWTLQELVAPKTVWFYNIDWKYLGSKFELQKRLQKLTGIETQVLEADQVDSILRSVSVAKRMSWVAKRQTTRTEDLAYSLLGIFDVNMPLLYGEGMKSFERLQEAILKVSDDQSLFAWGLPAQIRTMAEFTESFSPIDATQMHGMFAQSPSDFTSSDGIYVIEDSQTTFPPIVSNIGVRIELMVKHSTRFGLEFAVINCTLKGRFEHYLGFPIVSWGGRWHARCKELVLIAVTDLVEPNSQHPSRKPLALLIKAPSTIQKPSPPIKSIGLVWTASEFKDYYIMDEVRCSAHAAYDASTQTLTLSELKDDLHAILFFRHRYSTPQEILSHTSTIPKGRENITLNETYPKGSCIIKSRGKTYKHDEYALAFPPFAILVGGLGPSLWVENFLLLSDTEQRKPSQDYALLHSFDENFIKSCTTKSNLLSLLERKTAVEPLCGRWSLYERLLIMHWHYTLRKHSGSSDSEAMTEKMKLWMHTDLRLVPINLVETSLMLFIEIAAGKERAEWYEKWRPKWWNFKNHEKKDE